MNTFNFKTLVIIILQGLGAMLAFVVSLIIANMLLPLSPEISAAGQTATGFLAPPLAFLFNAFVNSLVLVWAARRSSFKGMAPLYRQLQRHDTPHQRLQKLSTPRRILESQ